MRQTALDSVYALAKRDPRVVFIGSDLGSGTLDAMRAEFPDRFFMEGVSEAAVIGMAAGLAMDGFIPYVNTIATFITRRAYEQVAIDACLHNLPVRLLGSGAGLVYAPLGPTHLAIEDVALMAALPNMTVTAPADAPEMRRLIDASLDWPGPLYVRFGKGGDPVVSRADDGFTIGRAVSLMPGDDVLIVSSGIMTHRALEAATLLRADGIAAGVLHVHTLKPFDAAGLVDRLADARLVVTVEEHVRHGGLAAAVGNVLLEADRRPAFLACSLPDAFPHGFGSQDHLLGLAGLGPAQLAQRIRERFPAFV
ncbi:MAG: transketolase C-terminal domain-containing protein [Candidatus Velthaea sp.]|jgi:transketolase